MFPLSLWRVAGCFIAFAAALGLLETLLKATGLTTPYVNAGTTIAMACILVLWPYLGVRITRLLLNPKRLVHDAETEAKANAALMAVAPQNFGDVHLAIYCDKRIHGITLGTKRNCLIAVSTGAIQALDQEELEALFAHEFGHMIGDHSSQSFNLLAALFMAKAFFGGVGPVIALFLLGVFLYLMRRNEFEADENGARLVGNRKMHHLIKRVADNAQEGAWTEKAWAEWISTHPRYSRRLARLQPSPT